MLAAVGHPVTENMPWETLNRFSSLKALIGNTPLLAVKFAFLGTIRTLYAKAEYLNLTGSIKDRMALHLLERGYKDGGLRPGVQMLGLVPHAFVAGVGTGGTIMGVGQDFRRHISGIKIHSVEPAGSPTLSTGHKIGVHRSQGISDEFIPSIVDLKSLDEVLAVSDGDSILMAQKLANRLGLGVGISSGCNFLAAVMAQETLPAGAVVATIFCDDNKKYMSTNLFGEEKVCANHLTPEIELIEFTAVERACRSDGTRFCGSGDLLALSPMASR